MSGTDMAANPVPGLPGARGPVPGQTGAGEGSGPGAPGVEEIIAGLPEPIPDGQELDDEALDARIAQVAAVAERLQQRLSDVSR